MASTLLPHRAGCITGTRPDHRPSAMLVLGCLAAAALLMNRPEIAERWPLALLGTLWVTVVRGDLATVRALTNRPVEALRETLRPMVFTSLLLCTGRVRVELEGSWRWGVDQGSPLAPLETRPALVMMGPCETTPAA